MVFLLHSPYDNEVFCCGFYYPEASFSSVLFYSEEPWEAHDGL